MIPARNRDDLRLITELVPEGVRILDVGCADGALLRTLEEEKGVDGRGIEISHRKVEACVRAGLSVIQGDADLHLEDFPDGSFDYVILSQTLQDVLRPRHILDELLRVGERAIVSFPNLGYWRSRFRLLCEGRMPIAGNSGTQWYDTPSIHLCTLADFLRMCDELGIAIRAGYALNSGGTARKITRAGRLAGLFVEQAVFELSRA